MEAVSGQSFGRAEDLDGDAEDAQSVKGGSLMPEVDPEILQEIVVGTMELKGLVYEAAFRGALLGVIGVTVGVMVLEWIVGLIGRRGKGAGLGG